MTKFRIRTVTVDAMQWVGWNWNDVCDWLPADGGANRQTVQGVMQGHDMVIIIETPHRKVTVHLRDWMVKDKYGGVCVIKPEVFAKSFHRLDETLTE